MGAHDLVRAANSTTLSMTRVMEDIMIAVKVVKQATTKALMTEVMEVQTVLFDVSSLSIESFPNEQQLHSQQCLAHMRCGI